MISPSTTHASTAPDQRFLVQARDIKLAYGQYVAVDRSSFHIPAGAITAVIGPNGSGKSTLLQAIAGVLPVAAGELTVLGRSPEKMRPHVSFVMQSVVFPTGTPITVKDVVSMGRYPQTGWFGLSTAKDRVAVDRAMEVMEITHLKKKHLEELSGGQRQRVYVAQGIAQGHEILVLDEPMTGLDVRSMKVIDQVIHEETKHGHSVVMTTHDLDEAAVADYVVLLKGKVLACGIPSEVLTRENLETAYGLGALHDTANLTEELSSQGIVALPHTDNDSHGQERADENDHS
ncbi:metal ABC transporter ATP-binding protein [Auritidibacter ignavus]|uniref:metal ABC transporter ATP-binding protein n=1 Tax=Auritidibacter ignavus TaxID=678932 RepID=UPI0024470375|nr:ABC transporter ATP-binding protein [Auritidibacter ignavus]WGH84030.1 ABC transporter ATP-binding protein [Auritidibacter ignavus]WGH90978.1 ABC transporter ATP-binding protein [Auritidibacter ignavus]